MRFSILSALGLCASAAAASVDSYISSEGPAAKQGLLANIGPDGAKAKAAGAKVRLSGLVHNLCFSLVNPGWSSDCEPQHRQPKLSV